MRFGKELGVVAVLLSGCGAAKKPAPAPAPKPHSGAEVAAPRKDEPLYIRDVGFQTPESVVYDARDDVYLVSNVDGSPLDVDDLAFISRLRPDGSVEALRWIDATEPDVELNAPKGMAIVGEVLYVADIKVLRKFERATGKALGAIELPGATFANDVCADRAGNIYVSDSGIAAGFTPSGSDAIFHVNPDGEVSVFAKDVSLGRPNGVAISGDGLWVATFGSGELYHLDEHGQRSDQHKLPKGSLDGVVEWKGRVFVASWEASAIYERDGDSFVERVAELPAPSDIGLDDKRERLLIPLFYDNTVVIYPL
jgi:sugar lactone lactonase YvrE